MATSDLDTGDRRAVARHIVRLRYPAVHPDTRITTTLDEAFEKLQLVEFYNRPVADWLRDRGWGWLVLTPGELDEVETVRDFGVLCYRHLTPLEDEVPEADVLADDGGEG